MHSEVETPEQYRMSVPWLFLRKFEGASKSVCPNVFIKFSLPDLQKQKK